MRLTSLVPGIFVLHIIIPASVTGQTLEERLRALEARVALIERSAARETEIFEQFSSSVFRVQAGLSDGTGFLVDWLERFVITNAHVVEDATTASVTLASGEVYPAAIVGVSQESDIAILRIDDTVCRDCLPLPLAVSTAGGRLETGDRVLALGYPLSNDLTMTSGVVSVIRADAILSDVNINPGNSGGPLLSMEGEVVGVNTFIDQGDAGPGIGGSVGIDRVQTVLAELFPSADFLTPISDQPLPTLPDRPYPAVVITAVAEAAASQERLYQDFLNIDAGNFTIEVSTPVSHLVLANALDREVASERRRREEQYDLPTALRYRGIPTYRDWYAYVGELTQPAVVVRIVPKLGETSGSVWGRILLGPNAGSTYRFRGDLSSASLLRNGVQQESVRGGERPVRVNTVTRSLDMSDVAYEGVYVFSPTVFEPDAGGRPPEITVAIGDYKNPTPSGFTTYRIDRRIVARIWEDFAPYYGLSSEPYVGETTDAPFETGKHMRLPWSPDDAQRAVYRALQSDGAQIRQMISREGTILLITWPGEARVSRISLRRVQSQTDLWVLGVDEQAQGKLEEVIRTLELPR